MKRIFLLALLQVSVLFQHAQAQGVLKLSEKYENGSPSGGSCSIQIPPLGTNWKTYRIRDSGCPGDVDYFALDNVPSTVMIMFYDNRFCDPSKDHHWDFTVETIKNPTTTRWVKMTEGRDTPIRGIIVAGVQLTERREYVSKPDWDLQMSCLKINNMP